MKQIDYRILQGDCLEVLKTLPDESVQTCVTSPPYFGLRDYGDAGQIGLESSPQEYVAKLVEVFAEVHRVLKTDGTCWLNLGDSYAFIGRTHRKESPGVGAKQELKARKTSIKWGDKPGENFKWTIEAFGTVIKPKDLMMIPHRTAIALQEWGWHIRQDIVWHKPNPMPESVTDRCTKSHEYIFLLTKSDRYYFDNEAIRERNVSSEQYKHTLKYSNVCANHSERIALGTGQPNNANNVGIHSRATKEGRNKRSVWSIPVKPFLDAHFATFPEKLIEPCILAGSREGDLVLDPFSGAGTTGVVSVKYGRKYLGIELNPDYIAMSEKRIKQTIMPLFETI